MIKSTVYFWVLTLSPSLWNLPWGPFLLLGGHWPNGSRLSSRAAQRSDAPLTWDEPIWPSLGPDVEPVRRESSLAAEAYQSCHIRPGAGLWLRRNSQDDRRAGPVNKWRDLVWRDKNGADIQNRAPQGGHTALGFMERGLRLTAYQFPSSAPTRLHSMALSWVLGPFKISLLSKPLHQLSQLLFLSTKDVVMMRSMTESV